MAVTGTLEQIRNKVRLITGRPSPNQLSNADLDNYINDFYVYDMGAHLKMWNLKNSLSPIVANAGGERVLTEGEWLYQVDSNVYTSLEPPFYVAGYEISFFQDIRSFMNYFPSYSVSQTLATGTGIAGPYTGTITTTPVLFRSVFISAMDAAGNTLVAECNAAGTITGDVVAGGTINLVTGAVAGLTFTAAIPAGNLITVQSLTFESARPQAVLYLNQALVFYPVPDTAYEIACTVYYNPDELGAGDQPEIRQWWNLIALGASIKIFTDNLDVESIAKIQPLFDQAKRLAERRTLKQLSTQRASTIYDYGTNYPYGYSGYVAL